MPEEKKKPTVRRPRKKTTKTTSKSTVKVTRSRKVSAVSDKNILDLSSPFSAPIVEDFVLPEVQPLEPQVIAPPSRFTSRLYRRISVPFVVLSLLFLGLVIYVTFIRLDITIVPKVKSVETKTNFTVYDRPEDYEVPGGSTLGLVRGMDIEYTQVSPSSGKKITGAEVSGTVVLINNYNKDQPLVATTRLLTPGNQLLRLTETVVVPAGGTITATVYAETADPSFALTNTRLTIPGLWAGLQDKIYAEAKVGSVSYKEKAEFSITQTDIDQAITSGKVALLEKAKTDIESTYDLYDQKLYILDEESLDVTVEGQVGEVKKDVTVKLKGSITVVAFNKANISGVLGTALSAVGSSDDGLSETTNPKFTVTSADVKQNVAEIQVEMLGTSIASTGEEIINPKKIVGLRRNQLEAYIQNQPEVESYELTFYPAFWQWSPYFANKISVSLKK
ncbi:hypothetical protein IPN41_01430 [Candidatus Falkowbacteria bacterium]|nr:MAG: hypothetical protein IPN41_01430 [Candidatus Falkowbacteria bacterium]